MISDSIVDLLRTGVSIVVGTHDASLMPECTRAWGICVSSDRNAATIFLSETIAGLTIENLRANGTIAVSCTRPTDHITCQLKGLARSIRPLTPEERDLSRRWHDDFGAELKTIGVSSELSGAWIVEPTVAVDFSVTDVFNQTPGPDAGRKVDR